MTVTTSGARSLPLLPATELRERYARRQLSPVEVAEAVLAAIERLNPRLNAIVTVTPEEALAQARVAEAAYAAEGSQPGALCGVPFTVKDTIVTRGVRTTMGSLLHRDWVPDFDPPSVARARAAGGLLLGKTNSPEFGWKGATDNLVFGPTLNPWDLSLSPGGSSGGAAAAVAAGLGPVALGTDAGGSARIPASMCGIYGFKPTFGVIPVVPGGPIESLAHVGILSRTVADAAMLLDVVAGPDARDRLSRPRSEVRYGASLGGELRGLRIAWSADLGFSPVEPEVRDAASAAALAFEDLGCTVEEVELGLEDPYEAVHVILAAASAGPHRAGLAGVRELIDPGRLEIVEEGFRLTAADVGAGAIVRQRFADALRTALEPYDLLLTPTTPVTAFPNGLHGPDRVAGERRPGLSWSALTYPFNLTGQPAASVPCPVAPGGKPVGLQIVGGSGDDALVLSASAAYETVRPWREAWPALVAEELTTPAGREAV